MSTFKGRIGVFGGRDVNDGLYEETIQIGAWLAKHNYLVFCGGAEGIMEAIAKGVSAHSGTIIGILKGDWNEGNNYLTIPIATKLGIGRNPLITYNCEVGLAIGGKYGTLSEIAYMLQSDKPIIGYKSWVINGMLQATSLQQLYSIITTHYDGNK